METRYHSVILDQDRCKGCTNCIKRCPTEAIRVRSGKAFILTERCIDCGECIRTCENHAKRAIGDDLSLIQNFSRRIALPAPSLFGQFRKDLSPERILDGLLSLGFDEVAEVAEAAELSTVAIREYLNNLPDLPKPQISSACPVVVRLIQMKFPTLIPNLIPIEPPYLTAARLARKSAAARLGLPNDAVGLFFITPCPAKITEVKTMNGGPLIDGVIPISSIYGEMKRRLTSGATDRVQLKSTGIGLGWARSGGENIALSIENGLAVDGIHNVLQVLEEIELERLTDVDYLEALACPDGCVGGALTVENRFVARVKIRNLADRWKGAPLADETVRRGSALFNEHELFRRGDLQALSGLQLDANLADAIRKMGQVEEVLPQLPGLDCGSCGSPTCRSLAEDMVLGMAQLSDCVFILREQVNDLAQELLLLAQKRPRALKDVTEDKEEYENETSRNHKGH
ncbi:MAG TPA: [Fe-Fe] hydrogenase large subunit C-terminal domain-containing protein [Bacillota bacterium]|nr:[Fe-Fe] hydrogenase large subunit C-terminal domain-containing protein [Bacillota bacterium]